MLMHAHHRAVDHLNLAVVSLYDRVHNPVPDAGLAPAVEAVVAGRVRPVALQQVAPWRARAQNPKNPVQDPSVVDPWHAARLVWQQRLYHRPIEIRQIVAHDQSPTVWNFESHQRQFGNPLYEYVP